MLGSSLIDEATNLLQDIGNVHWTRPELLRYLNQAQIQVVSVRPDANSVTQELTLVQGARQSLPVNGIQVLDVIRNVNGRAVTLKSREIIDSINLNWLSLSLTSTIKHYMVDQRDPRSFYVYPPAQLNAKVEVLFSMLPSEITETDPIFNALYENQIIDWILYRAYSKDAEYAAGIGKAVVYRDSFYASLGVKTQTDLAFDPIRSQPNQVQPNVR